MNMAASTAQPLSLGLEELLRTLRSHRWTLHLFGPRDRPVIVAAIYQWDGYADVLILRGERDASAYRVATQPGGGDVFGPDFVCWQYHSCALWTLRSVLALTPPRPEATAAHLESARSGCFLPSSLPKPTTIRPL